MNNQSVSRKSNDMLINVSARRRKKNVSTVHKEARSCTEDVLSGVFWCSFSVCL